MVNLYQRKLSLKESEIEEAAKPFQTMEEWFVHVEEYTEALKKKDGRVVLFHSSEYWVSTLNTPRRSKTPT